MSEASQDRVAQYLSELREEVLAPDAALDRAIAQSARWQQAVRTPLRAVGVLTLALGEGAALILGLRRDEP